MNILNIDPAKLTASKLANIQAYPVGADVKAGQPVFRDPNTSAIKPASAAQEGPASDVFGIAMSSQTKGQKVLVVKKDPELILGVDGLAPGDVLILGPEPGSIIHVEDKQPGNVVTVLAVADDKGVVNFAPVGSKTAIPAAKP